MNVEVGGTGPSPGLESRSTGSSQTLPTIKSSDDCERGSDSSESSTSVDEPSSASNSDSGSDNSGSDDTSNTGKKSNQANDRPQKGKVARVVSTPTIGSKSDGPTAVTKRRRTDETGSSVTTSIIQQPKTSNPHRKGNGQGQPRKTNTPFSRIKVDEIKFADERLKDNTFESRKGAVNDYGAKASANLIVTKGASFRKEKNKKKRGSYRGGDITVR